MRERILITGPGGRVGTHLIPLIREHFALRLLDLKPLKAHGDDEVLQGDIRNFDLLKGACDGVKAMIHLAAIPDEDEFYGKLLPFNLEGVYNAFEAARQAGVKKVIFASTGQT
ncbi:MAG TPA: NAD-dependent epimerase/dehydratase family protein, partial [Verrucomicrobiae bacterium]|nr:NAD-dependent epimerase/dehydratase family protein [Verrucomicrobiae bacterium]